MDVSRYGAKIYDLTPPAGYEDKQVYLSKGFKQVKVVSFGGPDVLAVSYNHPFPTLKKGEVRIKVLASSVSIMDTLIRRGTYSNGGTKKPPFVPGFHMVGVVEEITSINDDTNLTVGQHVASITTIGSYSEYVVLPEDQLTIIPSDVDPAEAVSLIQSFVTAYQMLTRSANVKPGQSILIHDAGGVMGQALIQIGVQMGVKMYGIVSASQADEVAAYGCYPIIVDRQKKHFFDQLKKLEPNGVHAVFDPMGINNLNESLRILSNEGGLYVTSKSMTKVGKFIDHIKVNLNVLSCRSKSPQPTVYSLVEWHESHHDWFQQDLMKLFQLLKERRVKPLIGKRMDLEEARHAHELLESKRVVGEIVLLVN